MAQRLEALRTEKGLSRPALSAALGFPKTAMEKFETGRQTPTQAQQTKLAQYFGVSVLYLRGETDDPTDMDTWLNGGALAEEPVRPVQPARPAPAPKGAKEDGAVFAALLKSPSFQALVQKAAGDYLRSPEGQALIAKAVRKELGR